jgi:hypothetical protein
LSVRQKEERRGGQLRFLFLPCSPNPFVPRAFFSQLFPCRCRARNAIVCPLFQHSLACLRCKEDVCGNACTIMREPSSCHQILVI